eukprot:jgi/Mesvir1/23641/Mv18313-RA.1
MDVIARHGYTYIDECGRCHVYPMPALRRNEGITPVLSDDSTPANSRQEKITNRRSTTWMFSDLDGTNRRFCQAYRNPHFPHHRDVVTFEKMAAIPQQVALYIPGGGRMAPLGRPESRVPEAAGQVRYFQREVYFRQTRARTGSSRKVDEIYKELDFLYLTAMDIDRVATNVLHSSVDFLHESKRTLTYMKPTPDRSLPTSGAHSAIAARTGKVAEWQCIGDPHQANHLDEISDGMMTYMHNNVTRHIHHWIFMFRALKPKVDHLKMLELTIRQLEGTQRKAGMKVEMANVKMEQSPSQKNVEHVLKSLQEKEETRNEQDRYLMVHRTLELELMEVMEALLRMATRFSEYLEKAIGLVSMTYGHAINFVQPPPPRPVEPEHGRAEQRVPASEPLRAPTKGKAPAGPRLEQAPAYQMQEAPRAQPMEMARAQPVQTTFQAPVAPQVKPAPQVQRQGPPPLPMPPPPKMTQLQAEPGQQQQYVPQHEMVMEQQQQYAPSQEMVVEMTGKPGHAMEGVAGVQDRYAAEEAPEGQQLGFVSG